MIHEIINLGGNVNHTDAKGKTALHYAIENKADNADVVKALLEHKADIDAKTSYEGITPLISAVLNGHRGITMVLVEE